MGEFACINISKRNVGESPIRTNEVIYCPNEWIYFIKKGEKN